jgi:hypothetical protein
MFAATLVVFFLPAISHTSPSSCTEITTTSSTTDWLVVLSLWVARVCSLPLYIPYFGAEYIFVSRLKQYLQYVVKSILTDATLTLWGFG